MKTSIVNTIFLLLTPDKADCNEVAIAGLPPPLKYCIHPTVLVFSMSAFYPSSKKMPSKIQFSSNSTISIIYITDSKPFFPKLICRASFGGNE